MSLISVENFVLNFLSVKEKIKFLSWYVFLAALCTYILTYILTYLFTYLLTLLHVGRSESASVLDIIIPGTNTSTEAGPNKIPAGEKVLVIKTPKGVYIRTNQGKIFAVRTTPKSSASSMASSASSSSLATVARSNETAVTVLTNSSTTTTTTAAAGQSCQLKLR